MLIVVLATVLSVNRLLPGAVAAESRPADAATRAALIQKAIVENQINEQRLFAQVAALGPTVVPEVEAYLKYTDPVVKRNAFQTLMKIPGIGARVLKEVLASKDQDLEVSAIYLAKGHLLESGVADAYVEYLITQGRASDVVSHARDHVLPSLDAAERKAVLDRLIPRIVQTMPSLFVKRGLYEPDCQWAQVLLLVLGQYGEPGDAAVLKAIAEARARAEAGFPVNERNLRMTDELHKQQDRVDEAAVFGAANLGDDQAWAAYSKDVLTGNPEVKLSRMKLFWRFRPTRRVLELADRLLDDKQEIMPLGTTRRYRRTCDLAMDVLTGWCTDPEPMPRRRSGITIYKDAQIAQAREVARSYVVRMQTSFGGSDNRRTVIELVVPDSRPATQPASSPGSPLSIRTTTTTASAGRTG
jgi:hypothetical protein